MWTSPRKSLVKGERFIRFEEIPEHTIRRQILGPSLGDVLRCSLNHARLR
jgi:hypothetical protein